MIFDPHIPSVLPSVYRCDDPLLVRLVGSGAIGSSVYEWDADAAAYLAAGEALDGQSLEPAVARAMNEWLFIAPKNTPAPIAATNWDAMMAGTALNMSGWRTLAAALLPLHPSMPTPTNINFVHGDYSRTGGVKFALNKYIQLGVNNAGLPRDDFSLSAWLSEIDTSGNTHASIIGGFGSAGSSRLSDSGFWNRYTTGTMPGNLDSTGLVATSRSSSSAISNRQSGNTTDVSGSPSANSSDPNSYEFVAGYWRTAATEYTNARAAFVGAGRAIDLTAMDSHLTSYMAALTVALA